MTRTHIHRTLAIAGLAFSMVAVGCGDGEPEPAPVVNRAPPPPPPAPVPVELSTLMTQMSADPRVQFPQRLAPTSEDLARGVITLASAIASGDAASARTVLSADSQSLLDALVSSGDWASETEGVEAVRVVELSSDALTLAVQDPRGAYPLVWSIASEGGLAFTGQPAPAVVLRRAADFDDGIPEAAPTQTQTAAVPGGGGFRVPTLAEFGQKFSDPEMAEVAGRFQVAHNAWISGLDPIGFSLNYRLGDRWNKKMGLPIDLMSDAGKGLAAAQYGLTAEQVTERLEQGNSAIEGGEQPTPAVALATLESYTGLPGFPQREQDVISEIAGILGTTSSEVSRLIEQGRSGGSSPFAEFVREAAATAPASAPGDPAEEEDDGRIIKQTPAGPLEIPVPPGNG
ncbi:MAG: hypothetical protein AAGG07_11790 [Planctomycetota bacterium]